MKTLALISTRAAVIWTISLLTCLMGLAWAAPPEFVYRGTEVPPEEAFKNGFPSRGNNLDVVQHVHGLSCSRSRDSAFVPTSASEAVAHSFVRSQLHHNNPVAYVYRIRASDNFYSAVASLMSAYHRTHDERYRRTADLFGDQQEWLANGGIPASQIYSVIPYRLDQVTNTMVADEELVNTRYVAASTRGNPNPLNSTGPSLDEAVVLPSYSSAPFSACFGCMSSEDSRRKRPLGDSECKNFSIKLSDLPTAVIDPVTGARVTRYVPWKSWQRTSSSTTRWLPMRCDLSPGGAGGDRLSVSCADLSIYFSRFSVSLHAGRNTSAWVDTMFDGATTSMPWVTESANIPVEHTDYSLAQYSYPTGVAFGSGNRWWSNILVLPEYPPTDTADHAVCAYKDAGYKGAFLCMPAGMEWKTVPAGLRSSISSIDTDLPQRFLVCDHNDFQGRCEIFKGKIDIVELNRVGLNDRIASVRRCHRPTPLQWEKQPKNVGLIGSIYVYDNPYTHTRDYFQLLTNHYGYFPTDQKSNADWKYMKGYSGC